jgi:hypothetical protein
MRPLTRFPLMLLAVLAGSPLLAQNECNVVPAATCPPGSGTQNVDNSDQHGPAIANWSSIPPHQNLAPKLALEKFVPAQGQTLIQAEVRITATHGGLLRIENRGPTSCIDDISINTNLNLQPLGGAPLPPLVLLLNFQTTVNLGIFDNVVDFAGPSGRTIPIPADVETRCFRFTDPATLAGFFSDSNPGDGNTETFEFDHTTQSNSSHDGCSPVTFLSDPEATLHVEVIYRVCSAVDCDNDGIPDDVDPDTSECGCREINRRRCASLLLYPELDNNTGCITLITVTMACCEDVKDDVDVEFRFINKDNCLKTDTTTTLTPCDTYTFCASAINPNPIAGYVYAYAKSTDSPAPGGPNPSGAPIVFNHLIGHEMIIDGIRILNHSMNAVGFEAFGTEGDETDRDADGIRDLNGPGVDGEYQEAPDEIFIPRFLGQDAGNRVIVNSDLILIGLSGGAQFSTTIDLLIYNDNEEVFSAQHVFQCWTRVPLLEISGLFDNDYLHSATDQASDEVLGHSELETGWMVLDGNVALSSVKAIEDPAFYAVLVDRSELLSGADLPFELCEQRNGSLLPVAITGDNED